MDELKAASEIAVSGLKAQAKRMRVVSENLANADSVASAPGQLPYRRKTVSFQNELDRNLGLEVVRIGKVDVDRSAFNKRHDPHHPAADREGYVLTPNVNPLIELMDMREAQRSYEANLNVITLSKTMLSRTVEMLR